MRRLTLLLPLFLVLFLPSQAQAQNYKQMVLGESTKASELSFPQISAGPGVITPDSPLFFLDKAYQSFRIALASPQDKAKIRAAISGERLAELRLMLAKNDEAGINRALSEMTQEMDQASEDLDVASGRGNDVSKTAVEVNQKLKEQRFALKSLVNQARGDLRLRLLAANASLKESKVNVEQKLPEEHLLNEIEDDLAETIEEEADMATESARRIEHAVQKMDELASIAAQKEEMKLKKTEENIDESILKKREQLKQLKERRMREIQEKKMNAAKEIREKTEEARLEFKQAKEEKLLLQKEDSQTSVEQ